MKRITILFLLLFAFSILMLFVGIPQITSTSIVLLDALSPMIASIILAVFSGSGLLIILSKRRWMIKWSKSLKSKAAFATFRRK